MSWQRSDTRVGYENPWIRVREDAVTRPDGTAGIYGVVEVRAPAVFVVAVTDDDRVVVVEIDRYAIGRRSWEIPAGGAGGDDLLTAAQRELREETGLAARDWQDLGEVHSLNGVADAPGRVFLARGLEVVGGSEQDDEGITRMRDLSWRELLQWIATSEITDNETLGALLKAMVALGRVDGASAAELSR